MVRHFEAVREAGEVPKGLDISMCLVVDAASIASVANKEATPFVTAVDVNYDATADEGDSYQGHFKVAISSLLPGLYPPLASQGLRPNELWPFAKPIFTSAYGVGD